MKTTIGIIGGGNMGGAILAGLCKEYPVFLSEDDGKRRQFLKRKYKISTGDLPKVVQNSDVLILAVKPQGFESLLTAIRPLVSQDKLFVSIAAGITCRYIEKKLGKEAKVIRTMPNLGVKVGEGMTGICPGKKADNGDLILACRLFSFLGKAVVVEEKRMNALTAVSGSGPAYFFYFVECMNQAAQSLGLDEHLSRDLVLQTVKGSLDLLENGELQADEWRAKVTSKGGTTQAAMDIFKKSKTNKIFKSAMSAAKKRAKELSK